MKRKFLPIAALSAALLLSLTACGNSQVSSTQQATSAMTSEQPTTAAATTEYIEETTVSNVGNENGNEFYIGNMFVKTDLNYIISDKSSIYYKDRLSETGKEITNMSNTGQLLSDGETVYFTVSAGSSNYDCEQYDVYAANISDNTVEKVFSGNYEIQLVTCKDGTVYYIDDDGNHGTPIIPCMLMKYDLSAKSSECVSGDNLCGAAYYMSGKIYYSRTCLAISEIDQTNVYSYDVSTGETEEIAENATMTKPGFTAARNALYFQTFSESNGEMTNRYVYMVNREGDLKKSAKIPDEYTFNCVFGNEGTMLLTQAASNGVCSYYTFDFASGETTAVDIGEYTVSDTAATNSYNTSFGILSDSVTGDLYFTKLPMNFGAHAVSVHAKKLNGNKLTDCLIGGEEAATTSSGSYWAVDGFWIDENFNAYEIIEK